MPFLLFKIAEISTALFRLKSSGIDSQNISDEAAFLRWCSTTRDVCGNKGIVYFVGNGASAMMASHMAMDEEQILGEKEFSIIKEGAILLNSARAELLGEQALLKALDDGQVGAAWFDVLWQEASSGVLCNYLQILLTPHISTYMHQCHLNMEMAARLGLIQNSNN